MVVYFSGTGNSRWCARVIAEALGDDLLDAGGYIKNGIAAELISGRPWVFVAPTYAWQLPRVFSDFIRSGCFNGSKEAYFVMTCGSEIGNAGEGIRALCAENGLTYMGVLQVPMPENYIAMFDVPGKKECVDMIAVARDILRRGVSCIRQLQPFPEQKAGVMDRLKSGMVNRGFYSCFVKADLFYSTDACVGCGKCADLCVLNNIHLNGGSPVWGRNCTHCMACISYCPVGAIEYGKRSIGKRRYRCEDYT